MSTRTADRQCSRFFKNIDKHHARQLFVVVACANVRITNNLLRAVVKKALALSICSGTVGADCFGEIIATNYEDRVRLRLKS
jgi:hypothetical protein